MPELPQIVELLATLGVGGLLMKGLDLIAKRSQWHREDRTLSIREMREDLDKLNELLQEATKRELDYVRLNADLKARIKIFENKLNLLEEENTRLKAENKRLRAQLET